MATLDAGEVVDAPEITKIVLFKHGIGFYVLRSQVTGNAKVILQFKDKEMDDILKSLFVTDLSQTGSYISSISYDASEDLDHVLKNVSIRLPTTHTLLEDFLADLKGARTDIQLSTRQVEATIVGLEYVEEIRDTLRERVPQLVVLDHASGSIQQIPFADIKSLALTSRDLREDLQFFLETIISRKQEDAKNIAIHCAAADAGNTSTTTSTPREIYLSYIQEAPVWKTSYRLILPGDQATADSVIPKGKGFLSGWGLVENQTPNDWIDVDLTLVAGMPVTFRYPIYKPQFIQRKVVPLPTKSSVGPHAIEDVVEPMESKPIGGAPGGSMRGFDGLMAATPAPTSSATTGGKFEETAARMKQALQKSIAISTKDMGELFEYHIAKPVSIARNQSALVPIVSADVEAKKVLLYDRDIHPLNPMACCEVTNTSPNTLESGPITLFIEDALAGEAMLPFLVKDDTRLLNYALEQAVVVHMELKVKHQVLHGVRFSGSYVYEYHYEDRLHIYKIRNKATSAKQLYLDHPKVQYYKILNAPGDPKDTPSKWRFTVDLEPKSAVKYAITTRREISQSASLWHVDDEFLKEKLDLYVKNEFIDARTQEGLEQIAALNAKKTRLEETRKKLEAERGQLDKDQARLRENLKVLGTGGLETQLKERFVGKLTTQEARYDQIQKELDQIEKDVKGLDAKIEQAFKGLRGKKLTSRSGSAAKAPTMTGPRKELYDKIQTLRERAPEHAQGLLDDLLAIMEKLPASQIQEGLEQFESLVSMIGKITPEMASQLRRMLPEQLRKYLDDL